MNAKDKLQQFEEQSNDEMKYGGAQDIFYSKGAAQSKLTLIKGDGVYLWDKQGIKYIDASSGPVTCNIGHANPRVLEAINKQSKQLSFAFPSTAHNIPNIEFAKQLTALAGEGFERALFVSGGSEAVDMAIKFCRQYRFATGEKQRYKLISCQPSYHGMTLGALAVCGDPTFNEVFGDMVTMAEKIPSVLDYRINHDLNKDEFALSCAAKLEDKILEMGQQDVLAFIIEPVGGSSSGAIAPPESYFNEVRRICDKYGVFLIYDEVMSGAGRTGSFLTSHNWPNARPDITVLAKGLGAGYIPLGAMLAPASLVDHLAELTGFNYAYTYNASPLACAVGLAVLKEIEESNLLENTKTMGNYLRQKLQQLQQATIIIGDVRGRGLLLGVEFVANQKTRKPLPLDFEITEKIRVLAQQRGLLIYGRRSNGGKFGDSILIAPPLNVTKEEIDIIVELFAQTISECEIILSKEGYI